MIDAEWERPVRSYACGLHPETLRQFDRLGLMPALQEIAHRIDRVFVGSADRQGTAVDLSVVGGPFPHVLTLRQSDLQDLLAQRLAQLGVEVSLGQEVKTISLSQGAVHCVSVPQQRGAAAPGKGASALPPGDAIVRRAEYVIAADGFDSMCRRALGIHLVDAKHSEAYAIFEFEADLAELQHEAYVVLGADSVSAFWPLDVSALGAARRESVAGGAAAAAPGARSLVSPAPGKTRLGNHVQLRAQDRESLWL